MLEEEVLKNGAVLMSIPLGDFKQTISVDFSLNASDTKSPFPRAQGHALRGRHGSASIITMRDEASACHNAVSNFNLFTSISI